LGISYSAEYLTVGDRIKTGAVSIKGHDGAEVGHPGGGEFYALRSFRVALTGKKRQFYDVIYHAQYQSDGVFGRLTRECANGEQAEATGTEFDRTYFQVFPSGFISHISVTVVKKRQVMVAYFQFRERSHQ
jgi:hypothetical protein